MNCMWFILSCCDFFHKWNNSLMSKYKFSGTSSMHRLRVNPSVQAEEKLPISYFYLFLNSVIQKRTPVLMSYDDVWSRYIHTVMHLISCIFPLGYEIKKMLSVISIPSRLYLPTVKSFIRRLYDTHWIQPCHLHLWSQAVWASCMGRLPCLSSTLNTLLQPLLTGCCRP